MVVETRVSSIWSKLLMDGHDGSTPLEEGPSYVRFVCKVTVQRASFFFEKNRRGQPLL
jgi:hypothetical protein